MPKITIQIPDGEEAVYEFDEEQVNVGRNASNDIAIPHDSMSGSHATLTLNQDGSYTLTDQGSTNGSFVNGEQVVERVLADGADILFGQVGAIYSHPEMSNVSLDSMEEYAEEPAAAEESFINQPLEASGRPANYGSISPFPKSAEKADPVAKAALGLGLLAIAAAIGLVAIVFLKL
ncbi:MAG: pSer/pThr/pTyr-binding forkhead associated (FHA) protein [Verrucomicrobiales bacterium]|jgi:pSer/pThr/pTyr-binding forkhead associated (FHA) protein